METTFERVRKTMAGEKEKWRFAKRNGKKKKQSGQEDARELHAGKQCGLIPAKNFRELTATDIHGRTSSFVPSGKSTARLEIGHLPDEIEDLHRRFAGYYR